MPPPLALFDLDNTLVDRRSAFRLWAETWAAARDLDNAAVDWLVEADHNGDASRMRFFAHAIKRFGLVKKPDQLLSEYRATFPGYFKPDPTVNDGLRALRANGWKIGVVTNGPPTQRAKLVSAGLIDLIDGLVISQEVGSRKPESAIFRLAATECDATLEHGWMVGDNPEADIKGAAAVRLNTIWVSAAANWPLADLEPGLSVVAIEDALAHLQGLPAA